MIDTIKIGSYLKELRIKSSYTQQVVADKLGLTPQAISKWERSESMPDITLLPELAQLYKISIEDILFAGAVDKIQPDKIPDLLNRFVDESIFAKILIEFQNAANIRDILIPPDIFMILSVRQKDEILKYLPDVEDYGDFINSIIHHLNINQRSYLMIRAAENGDYNVLENLIPLATRDVRTNIVTILLERREFNVLEEIILFLNREQKSIIIDYFLLHDLDTEIIEGFLPYFDRYQQKIIIEIIEQN